MPTKQQLDKAAWEWAEKVEDPKALSKEHLQIAYRINLKPCKPYSCRRNCKGNPHCLSGLGEKKWLNEIEDEAWHEVDDPNTERKELGSFSGLKNLGATCYVNSFLQVWYHNPIFRKAIYLWNPNDDPQEFTTTKEPEWKPRTAIGNLQLIFALLQFSKRRYVDPTPFITALGLNATLQQDAQEFCKLFISLLEERLSLQSNPRVRNVIQELYQGQYSYITKCHKCLTESSCPATFYELDLNIKGHKDLQDCLEEFLKEEKLENNNQYHCEVCGGKQDATRSLRLVKLPPVLNLQLLRFVFDRQTSRKKKISSFIRFPETLDMSKYLAEGSIPGNQVLYQLSAVLIHKGPSAYSGHYVAHVRDRITGSWFKFNDENVEKMEAKKLSSTDSEAGGKAPKLTRGTHASNNAYMLVYLRQGNFSGIPSDTKEAWDLPDYLTQAVAKDNSLFEEWIIDLTAMREQCVVEGKTKQEEIKQLYEKLIARKEENSTGYEWISTEWLTKWLACEGNIENIDHRPFVCPHSKLSPDAVTKMKCITTEAADALFSVYSCNFRFRDGLCQNCVTAKCLAIKTKLQLQEESKQISTLLKQTITSEDKAFWVGKSSLRSWKKMVMTENSPVSETTFEDPPSTPANNGVNNVNPDLSLGENDIEDSDEAPLSFNEEICCEHGLLRPDEKIRRLVQENVWNIFKKHFPTAPEFPSFATPCSSCQVERKGDNMEVRLLALNRRNQLPDLYYNRNRPLWLMVDAHLKFYLVSLDFIDAWRKFIREPFRWEPVTAVCNQVLICQHGGLLYKPALAPQLVLLWQKEWQILEKLVDVDLAISVTSNPQGELITDPLVCEACANDRNLHSQLKQMSYSHAKIYVRKYVRSDSSTGEDSSGKGDDYPATPSPKRPKLEEEMPGLLVRRSNRRRKMRDEKEVVVSSSQTLLDLKKQLLSLYCVLPCEQKLYLDKVPLEDDAATLGSLNIMPGALVTMEVDPAVGEGNRMDDIMVNDSAPETGFKGTELVRC